MIDLEAVGLRSYVAEPDRGRRDWSKEPQAQIPVYANRRRIRGARGRRLMASTGERIERSFAHLYDTGGMRRTHLRGHTNILKRLLIHAGGFNLGLVMRHLIGSGTPRDYKIARRPSSPRFRCSWALLDAGWSRFRMAPTHGRCALLSVTDHHHRLLLTGDTYTRAVSRNWRCSPTCSIRWKPRPKTWSGFK